MAAHLIPTQKVRVQAPTGPKQIYTQTQWIAFEYKFVATATCLHPYKTMIETLGPVSWVGLSCLYIGVTVYHLAKDILEVYRAYPHRAHFYYINE